MMRGRPGSVVLYNIRSKVYSQRNGHCDTQAGAGLSLQVLGLCVASRRPVSCVAGLRAALS